MRAELRCPRRCTHSYVEVLARLEGAAGGLRDLGPCTPLGPGLLALIAIVARNSGAAHRAPYVDRACTFGHPGNDDHWLPLRSPG
jgi:hypothetical protein